MDLDGLALHGLDATVAPRALLGASGLLLLFWGARVYHLALRTAAFVGGALGVWVLLDAVAALAQVSLSPAVIASGAVVGGVAALVLAVMAHRFALVAAGAVVGLVVGVGVAAVVVGAWWLPIVGALVGAVALPLLWKPLLKLLTPAVGALAIAAAVGRLDAAWLVGLLWLIGAAVQLGFGGKSASDEEDKS